MSEIERLRQDRGPYSQANLLSRNYATASQWRQPPTLPANLFSNAYGWFAYSNNELLQARLATELRDLQRKLRAFELVLLTMEIKLSA